MITNKKFARTTSAAITAFLFAAIFAACGSSESDEATSYARVDSTSRIFETADFENAGFKVVKKYDIEGLTGATAAMHGFQKNVGVDPLSYELRFYNSHDEAVKLGQSLAVEVTGEDAVMVAEDMTWAGGKKEQRERAAELGGYAPFYWDYAVYGNVIILCEGDWPEQSQEACDRIKQTLEPTPAD